MRKQFKILVLSLSACLALTACDFTQTEDRDLEGVKLKNPAKAELYANVNNHPNIARFCIDGVAFATTTREWEPVIRVPEWDAWCKS